MNTTSSTIVQRLWNYCNVLRDDGMSYGDYVEQLTYLLFLKMDAENASMLGRPSAIPSQYNWASLQRLDGDDLESHYRAILAGLGQGAGLIPVIFRQAQNKRLAAEAGVNVDAAMISDVPGYTWGLVPAMNQAGIRFFSTAPNYFDRIGDILVQWENKPFWWVGPDGRSRVLVWIPFKGYAMSHVYPKLTAGLVQMFQDQLDRSGYPYDIAYMRWSGHGDNAEPDPAICDFVKDWSAKNEWPKFIISSASEAFQAFEKRYGDKIPTAQGDFTPYWEDGAASSARETALNRASADRLSCQPWRFPHPLSAT